MYAIRSYYEVFGKTFDLLFEVPLSNTVRFHDVRGRVRHELLVPQFRAHDGKLRSGPVDLLPQTRCLPAEIDEALKRHAHLDIVHHSRCVFDRDVVGVPVHHLSGPRQPKDDLLVIAQKREIPGPPFQANLHPFRRGNVQLAPDVPDGANDLHETGHVLLDAFVDPLRIDRRVPFRKDRAPFAG